MSTYTPSPTESEIHIRDFLAANPKLDAELGEVEVMTDRYTNQEWAELIKETQRKVLSEVDQRGKEGARGWKYEVPELGDGGLAKTVDHTVLKLDAKEAAIDALCAEARVEGFKVGFWMFVATRLHMMSFLCLMKILACLGSAAINSFIS
jgi:deoxyribose-phosphate aldolase